MRVTPVYAAILAVLFILLSVRAIGLRRQLKVAVGDGGNEKLTRALRAQANFAEYVPFSLMLIAFLETRIGPVWLVHALCGSLLVGRFIHAAGISRSPEKFSYRVCGMSLTLMAISIAALAILAGYWW